MRLPVALKIAAVTAGASAGQAWLAHAGRVLLAVHDVDLDLRHLAHAQHRVAVEVALLDLPVLERDLAVERGGEAVDDRALALPASRSPD